MHAVTVLAYDSSGVHETAMGHLLRLQGADPSFFNISLEQQ
jgi:hypothetical protein